MALKKEDIEKFQKQLLQLKAQINKTVNDVKEDVKSSDESKGYSQHQADEGTDDFGRTISLELTNKEFAILKQIDRALEKIDEGTYGVCDITGESIPKKRLDALPYANMTVKAQEMVEKGLIE